MLPYIWLLMTRIAISDVSEGVPQTYRVVR